MCAPSGDFCVAYDGKASIIDIRKYLRGEPQTEEEAEFVEAMGFTVILSQSILNNLNLRE